MRRLLLAVLFSGAASLVYQVAWTRRVASVTSATVTAQAIVLAVFMAGLGVGSYLAAKYAQRMRRPLVAYALAELAAGIVACVSMDVLTSSAGLRTWLVNLGVSPTVGLWMQLGAMGAFLLVPTTLLGASLPLVVEHIERSRDVDGPSDAQRRGVSISLLYAVNTLGATAGCLAAGFAGIERLGLRRTTQAGAALAFVAVLLAFTFSRSASPQAVETVEGEKSPAHLPRRVVIAAALSGAIGIGAEIAWTRLFSLIVMNTVYAFTQVLAAVLLGIALGGFIAAYLMRLPSTKSDPVAAALRWTARMQIASAVLLAIVPVMIALIATQEHLQLLLARGSLGAGAVLLAILLPAAALNASTLPLLVTAAGARRGSRALGLLYSANTAGSVAGSIVVAFVLLPLVGTAGACGALEIVSLGLAVMLGREEGDLRRFARVLVPGAAICAGLSVAVTIPRDLYEARMAKTVHIRELREGAASDVMVTDDEAGPRRIWINSTWVAGTGGGHHLLGHVPALFVESPKRVLGIALGTGQTFAAVLASGATQLDIVEIDDGVIGLSRTWFKEANGGLFERPGVVLHHDDGRAFLRATRDTFDVIVLEPLQAWSAGTSNLYSREFYEEARRVLAPGGVVAQWIPFYGQDAASTQSMVRTAAEIFPGATLWLDDHDGILILQRDATGLSPKTFLERTRARGLTQMLEGNAVARPADFFSMLLLDPAGLEQWDRGAPILADDRPFLEFAAARDISSEQYRPIVRSILDLGSQAPLGDVDPTERAVLEEAGVIREGCLRAALCGWRDVSCRALAIESALQRAPSSELLRKRFRVATMGWAAALDQRTDPGKERAQLELFQRALKTDPTFGDAALSLGVLLFRSGRPEEARAALEHASTIESAHARAVALLNELPPPK